jgi:hypothetical protein
VPSSLCRLGKPARKLVSQLTPICGSVVVKHTRMCIIFIDLIGCYILGRVVNS